MKFLLRQRNTKLFFANLGCWTEEKQQAAAFPSVQAAIQTAGELKVRDAEVLLSSEVVPFETAVPIIPPLFPLGPDTWTLSRRSAGVPSAHEKF
ncbi:MAG TPA: hypothetical protein VN673_16770 [Clostridia bacterium]|nr:hypothetical protein [Clostridia bacterium]